MKKTLAKLLASLVMTLILLAVLEGVLRWLFPKRGEAHIPPKAPDTVRVVTLGESTVYGTPVPELGLVSMLGHELRRMGLGDRLDLVNLGKPGTDSEELVKRLRQALDSGTDLVILLMGHNEYLNRRGEHPDSKTVWRDRIQSFALGRVLDSVAARIRDPRKARQFIMPDRLTPYDRASPWFAGRQDRFRRNLGEMVDLCRRAGVPLVLCTAPCNLADWPPVHKDIAWCSPIPDYDAVVADLRARIEAGQWEGAARRAAETQAQYGEEAMLQYLQGRAAQAASHYDEALRLYQRARDLDPYPWRASSALNDITRSFSDTPEVLFEDIEQDFIQAASNGLVGFDLIADNCHPTPRGSALVAARVARRIRESRRLGDLAEAHPPEELLAEYLADLGKRGQADSLQLEWNLQNAIYCMKSPFYFFEVSQRYLEAALQAHPENWRLYANRAAVHWLCGRIPEGRADLDTAERLKGSRLDIEDRSVAPYLKEAMGKAGIPRS